MSTAARRIQSVEDYLALDSADAKELIRGSIVDKAEVTGEHSLTQGCTYSLLRGPFQRRGGGGGGPGGWWFFTELEVQLGEEIFKPDVCGFRRERMPVPSRGRPERLVPDWVCEILSPSNPERDRVEKLQSYFAAGVPHYWIIDPLAGTLEVLRRLDLAFAVVLTAHRGQRVRPEPFEAVEFIIDELLGADPQE